MTRDYVLSAPTPDALQRRFAVGEAPYVIAARLAGPIVSAFDAPPEAATEKGERAKPQDHKNSTDAANIMSLPIAIFSMTGFGCRNKIISASVLACRLPIMEISAQCGGKSHGVK